MLATAMALRRPGCAGKTLSSAVGKLESMRGAKCLKHGVLASATKNVFLGFRI